MSDSYKKFIIIKTVDLPPEQKYQGLSKDNEYEHLNTLKNLGIPMGTVPMTEEEASYVESLPQVSKVEEVYEIKVDPPDQPDSEAKDESVLQSDGALALHKIPEVHALSNKGQGVTVADLDTGLDNHHATALGSRLKERADFTGSSLNDLQGHGTHTAGTIMQVAPECSLLVGKVLGDNGSGTNAGIIRGINWAVEKGAQVINLSLGGFPVKNAANDALSLAVNAARDKGVLVPVAAGNDQDSNGSRYCADESTPSAALKAICVGAVDTLRRIARFSNIGNSLDIAAVGVNVISWGLRGTYGASMSGTSMATPHVAGIAALILKENKDPNLAETALYKGCDDTSLEIVKEGYGVANALKSVELLKPQEPQGYFPHLPRFSRSKFYKDKTSVECVVTDGKSAKDSGRYVPKV